MKSIIKKIITIITIFILVVSFSSCSLKSVLLKSSTEDAGTSAQKDIDVTSPTEVNTTVPQNDDSEYPLNEYEHLNEQQKEVYDKIISAIKSREETIDETVLEFKKEIYDKVFYYAVAVDHPEYFWVRAFSESYKSGSEIVKADFRLKYLYTTDKLSEKQSKIDNIVSKIKSQVGEKASDYDKALAVYNYIVDNCSYDDECASGKADSQNDSASTMEGALIDKSAVCTGYSRAYKYIMNKLGIKCSVVNTSEHEWNLIMLDNDYYYTDVTWGDTSQNRYAYFCMTTKQLMKKHKMPKNNTLPICTATKDSYYSHNN